MTTYYHHRSMKNLSLGIIPMIDEHTPRAYPIEWEADVEHDKDERYYVSLPNGSSFSGFATVEESLAAAEQHMLREGWVTDRSIAERRAAKEVELRKSGRMKFAGPNFSRDDFKACQREIMEIV